MESVVVKRRGRARRTAAKERAEETSYEGWVRSANRGTGKRCKRILLGELAARGRGLESPP